MMIVASILVATALCVAVLVGFWLFTLTPTGRRIGEHEHPHTPHPG